MQDIFLYSDIVEGTAADIIRQIQEAGDNDINLHINSKGGDAYEAFSIYNTLRSIPNKVTTFNDGIAASAASIVMMGGEDRIHSEASQTGIHNSRSGLMYGMTAKQMKAAIPVFEAIDDIAASIYSEGTGIRKSKIEKLMSEDTVFTAKQAKRLGFATQLTGRLKAVALFNPNTNMSTARDKLMVLAKNLGITVPDKEVESLEANKDLIDKLAEAATDKAELEVQKKIEFSKGADILTKDLTPYLEFKQHVEEIKPMLQSIVAFISEQPTKEENETSLKQMVAGELATLLNNLKSAGQVFSGTGDIKEETADEFKVKEAGKWQDGLKAAEEHIAGRHTEAPDSLRKPEK